MERIGFERESQQTSNRTIIPSLFRMFIVFSHQTRVSFSLSSLFLSSNFELTIDVKSTTFRIEKEKSPETETQLSYLESLLIDRIQSYFCEVRNNPFHLFILFYLQSLMNHLMNETEFHLVTFFIIERTCSSLYKVRQKKYFLFEWYVVFKTIKTRKRKFLWMDGIT
jgi:hypothetical protein